MVQYRYKAFDDKKKIVRGSLGEDDLELAKEQLRAKGYEIIWIKQSTTLGLSEIRGSTLKLEQLSGFCGETATILDSGVSIMRGLEILHEQAQDKKYQKVVYDLQEHVKKGLNLSMAMDRTGAFPDLLVDMVASGEISSHLVEVLVSMEDFYNREAKVRSKIRGASIYPAILLCVSIVMVLFFNFFVFTELRKIFSDVDNLPGLTRVLIASLDYLNAKPLVVLGVIGVVTIVIFAFSQIPVVRYSFDRFSLKMPLVGDVRSNIVSSRIASSMGIFIKSAVPLTKVLSVVENIAANKYISRRLGEAKEEIIRGRNISDAFEDTGAFDSMMIQMIRIGEETGRLEDMLFKLSDIYDKKSNTSIERLVSMVEPIFTVIVGLVVGVLILAMAMPIFDMSRMLGG